MSETKIIGIGGVSQSGKSSLAEKIKKRFSGNTLVWSQDDFTNPESQIPKINNLTDWEHPDSIDFQQIKNLIEAQKENYDLIILEGLLAFHDDELANFFDIKIMLTISKDTFLQRRKQETRWGSEPDWFIHHVWDSFLNFGNYQFADHQLSGESPISNDQIDVILNKLNLE